MSIPTPERTACTVRTGAQIDVHIVYARPDAVWQHVVHLTPRHTVHDALTSSGFFDVFPDFSSDTIEVGIYGKKCALDRTLNHNDRIEIYRPLVFDPMESRRRRARHRQNTRD